MARREVVVDDRPVTTTTLELDLLAALASQPGRVFSRAQLLEAVWGWDYVGDDRVVDVHIRDLRRTLGDDAANPRDSSGPSATSATGSSPNRHDHDANTPGPTGRCDPRGDRSGRRRRLRRGPISHAHALREAYRRPWGQLRPRWVIGQRLQRVRPGPGRLRPCALDRRHRGGTHRGRRCGDRRRHSAPDPASPPARSSRPQRAEWPTATTR